MAKFKKPLLFALGLLPVAALAGILIGYYQLDTLPEEVVAEVIAQLGSIEMLIAVGGVQAAIYGLFCGFFGCLLADKLGLWKPIRFQKRELIVTLAASVIGGALFSLDHWVFGSMIDGIQEANVASLSVKSLLASVLYGGVMEEVMLRLFFMSLIAFLIRKVFYRKRSQEETPEGVFIVANVIAALLFAAGHLPATLALFGQLTPLLLFRCFLLNGGFGLLFGWLYRKYGIMYSMISHALFHIVSKLIWFIFL